MKFLSNLKKSQPWTFSHSVLDGSFFGPLLLLFLGTIAVAPIGATFTPNLEFGLLTINSGAPVHLLGLSINEDGRLGYLSNSRDPFIGKFASDGRVYVPGQPSTYLTVGGVNRTSLQIVRNSNVTTTFDVNSEGHFLYRNSSLFIAVNEGSGQSAGPGSPGGPTGSLYRYYVYDSQLLSDIRGKEYYTVALRVLWSQSGKGMASLGSGTDNDDDASATFAGNVTGSALAGNLSVVASNYTLNGSVLSQVSGSGLGSKSCALSYAAVAGMLAATVLVLVGTNIVFVF
ncbi:uncharacterized protein SAPINGB_P005872 [Magnusiomyces paraingens]|uniref:Uncharacterized protein n=1 Tax=Magnusiomyces paraingens TaxID=2606893 RepID=A0A5E8C2G3_9ASCO|nr:uncharacterized protein SAPINGB_P005872 [Saprochaete ingens]VVT57793.1 unnamed protein product [Saprochaete ingens]